MTRVFVIGATGGIGSLVCERLAARGGEAVGMHRRPEQAAQVRSNGAQPCIGDLETVSSQALGSMMKGCTAVVFAAGASEEGMFVADLVDREGVVKALRACEEAGIRRFLHVSAFPDAQRGKSMPPAFEHYMKVKRQADVEVASSELDWVIVRPGSLTDAKAEPRVRVGAAVPYGKVSRGAVASVLVELLSKPLNRLVLEVTDGPLAVPEALEKLAAQPFL